MYIGGKILIGISSRYRMFSYNFRGKYSFLNLEIQSSHYIKPKVTVHKVAETIQGRKLFKGGNYMRKYGILYTIVYTYIVFFKVQSCKITVWELRSIFKVTRPDFDFLNKVFIFWYSVRSNAIGNIE